MEEIFANLRGKRKISAEPVVIADLGSSIFLLTAFMYLTRQVLKQRSVNLDQSFEQYITKKSSPELDRYFKAFTLLGKEQVTLSLSVVMSGFLLRRKKHKPLAPWLVLISTWFGWLLAHLIKIVVKRPRPISVNALTHHPNARSYPSGHSMVAVCFYGMLIWLILSQTMKPLTRILMLTFLLYLILMIGVSRVFLKEHHITDVLGGYFLGSFYVFGIIGITNLLTKGDKEVINFQD